MQAEGHSLRPAARTTEVRSKNLKIRPESFFGATNSQAISPWPVPVPRVGRAVAAFPVGLVVLERCMEASPSVELLRAAAGNILNKVNSVQDPESEETEAVAGGSVFVNGGILSIAASTFDGQSETGGTQFSTEVMPDLSNVPAGTRFAVTEFNGVINQSAIYKTPPFVAGGTPFGMTVYAESTFGQIDTSFNGTVTLSLNQTAVQGLPSTGNLTGLVQVQAVDGIATFDDLSINQAAFAVPGISNTGDTLTISGNVSGTNVSSTSPNFSVGFSPAQIRAAYGVSQLQTTNALDGAGQTIAIVVAYDDPNLLNSTDPNFQYSDLAQFDTQMGLPDPPSFKKIDVDGGTDYPETDPTAGDIGGWESEEIMDVESGARHCPRGQYRRRGG